MNGSQVEIRSLPQEDKRSDDVSYRQNVDAAGARKENNRQRGPEEKCKDESFEDVEIVSNFVDEVVRWVVEWNCSQLVNIIQHRLVAAAWICHHRVFVSRFDSEHNQLTTHEKQQDEVQKQQL